MKSKTITASSPKELDRKIEEITSEDSEWALTFPAVNAVYEQHGKIVWYANFTKH